MKKETIFSEVETANSKQLAVLKANFPQCFDKNGAFIQEKLLEIIRASEVELSKESYSLNWLCPFVGQSTTENVVGRR